MADRLRRATTPAVLLPVALVLALILLVVAASLLGSRAATVGRSSVGDTGPALVGVALPADGGAGPPVVVLTDSATTYPQAAAIRELVQRSIDARNSGDFPAWRATATDDTRIDAASFAAGTRTMRTGSVVIRRIDPVGAGELVVLLGYITTQAPNDAPPDVRVGRLCWQNSTVIETGRDGPRIADSRPGSMLRTPC